MIDVARDNSVMIHEIRRLAPVSKLENYYCNYYFLNKYFN